VAGHREPAGPEEGRDVFPGDVRGSAGPRPRRTTTTSTSSRSRRWARSTTPSSGSTRRSTGS
jgi:hypothetical protein